MVTSLSLLLWLSGCAHDGQALRDDAHEREWLATSARLYWQGLRWSDVDRAANFIESDLDRAAFRAHLDDQLQQQRVIDATVLQVQISEDPERTKGDPWRTGAVKVRVEGYTLPAQVVQIDDIQQAWYRTPTGWWLTWSPPPLDAP
ncbi:MAG: hypothetical protein AAFV53_27620 [Myxococcota bacterium]